jgi:hypothetical protein
VVQTFSGIVLNTEKEWTTDVQHKLCKLKNMVVEDIDSKCMNTFLLNFGKDSKA